MRTKLFGSIPLIPTTVHQRRYTRPLPQSLEGHELPKTSVVIPTRNRPQLLKECLSSVLGQSIKPEEVIVVDDGNLAGSWLMKQFEGSDVRFKHVRKGIPGIARSRNIGANWAEGEIVCFVDDDIVLEQNYIEEILKVFISDKEEKIGGVDGHIVDEVHLQGVNSLSRAIFGLHFPAFEGVQLPNFYHEKVSSAPFPVYTDVFLGVAAYRRSVLDLFSFDELNYPGYTYGEDTEFAYRVSKDYKLVYTPFARCHHKRATSGRPNTFKLGIQGAFCVYKARALNDEIGVINWPLAGWLFFGKNLNSLKKVFAYQGTRWDDFYNFLGRNMGILLLPLSIPSENRLSYELAQWLSKVED